MASPTIPAIVPNYLHPFWKEPDVTQQRDAEFFIKTTRLHLGQLDSMGNLDRGPGGIGYGLRDVPVAAEPHIRARLERDPKHADYRKIRARKMVVREGPPPEFTAYVADALAAGRIDSQGADEMHGVWVQVHNRMALQPNRHEGAYEYAVQRAWVAVTMDDLREFWAVDYGIPEAQSRWQAHVATLSAAEQDEARKVAAAATREVEANTAELAERAKQAERVSAKAEVASAVAERDQAREDRERAEAIRAEARNERKRASEIVRQAEEAKADAAAMLRRAESARQTAEATAARAAKERRDEEAAQKALETAQRRAQTVELAKAEAEAARAAKAEAEAARQAEEERYGRTLRGRWGSWKAARNAARDGQ